MRRLKARVIRNIGTEAAWLQKNPVLGDGEQALVRFGGRVRSKIGNGSLTFSQLLYQDNDMKISVATPSFPFQSGEGAAPAGVYMANGNGTYNGNLVVNTDGKIVMLVWDGITTLEKVETLLPQPEGTDQVVPDGVKLVNQKGVFNAVKPVNSLISGGNVPFGIMQDISTYTITDANEYVEVNLRKPTTKKGKVKKIQINVSKVGNIKFCAFKDETPTGASLATLRNMAEVQLNCPTVGINTFEDVTHFNNLLVDVGYVPGVRKIAGGALPTRIALTTGTKGCARLASTSSPTVGNASNMGIHPYEFAIEFEVEYEGLDKGLTATNAKITGMESDIGSAIKDADISLKYGNNLLNALTRIKDKYIDSAGNIQTAAAGSGWEMAAIDVSRFSAGQRFVLSRIVISAGHSAWYLGETKLSYAGSYGTADMPKGYTYPNTILPNLLLITTMRGGVANPDIMFNIGEVALPFEPYVEPLIDKIKNHKVSTSDEGNSGNMPTDQDLYKSSNVRFATVTFMGATFPVELWDEVSATELGQFEMYAFDDGNPISYSLRLKK